MVLVNGMHLHSFPDAEFTQSAAGALAAAIRSVLSLRDHCLLAVSGGNTPAPIYDMLGTMPNIEWSKVHLCLVDERCVPPDHNDSTQHLLRNTLLRTAAIPEAQCHFPDTTLAPQACAVRYATSLRPLLKQQIDIAVLGMGTDGHIASLFPPVSQEALGDAIALHTRTDRFAVQDRITLTLSALSSVRHTFLLLRGQEKIQLWQHMIASTEGSERWPMKYLLGRSDVTVLIGKAL